MALFLMRTGDLSDKASKMCEQDPQVQCSVPPPFGRTTRCLYPLEEMQLEKEMQRGGLPELKRMNFTSNSVASAFGAT